MGWKPTPSWVKGRLWQFFHETPVRLNNDTAHPSTQQASSIWSTHSKYNPSRALVNGFCHFSTNIVAFRNWFLLNWSDVETPSQLSSFASLSLSHEHTRRNASQTMRVWCMVRDGVLAKMWPQQQPIQRTPLSTHARGREVWQRFQQCCQVTQQ